MREQAGSKSKSRAVRLIVSKYGQTIASLVVDLLVDMVDGFYGRLWVVGCGLVVVG